MCSFVISDWRKCFLASDIQQKRQLTEALIEQILSEATRQGASAAEVAASDETGLSVTARARSIASRMKGVGCQRNLPMPKVAQQ